MAPNDRVFIYRLGSLGDSVVALPSFRLVAQAFPDAQRLLLTNFPVSAKAAPLDSILRGGGFVHDSISYPLGIRDAATLVRLGRKLHVQRTDVLVYLAGARGLTTAWRDVAYFRCCGFRKIVGAPLTPELQRLRTDADGDLERESERLARCMRQLGRIDLGDRRWWDLNLSSAERARAKSVLSPLESQPFVAINMGGKAAEKNWGAPNWSAFLGQLGNQMVERSLVLLGGPEDSRPSAAAASTWTSGKVIDLCGRLTPRESAAVLERAELFIGHDSGPLHLSDAVGTPSVGLFGGFNVPKVWYPSGRHTRIIHDMRGMSAITPTRALDATLSLRMQFS